MFLIEGIKPERHLGKTESVILNPGLAILNVVLMIYRMVSSQCSVWHSEPPGKMYMNSFFIESVAYIYIYIFQFNHQFGLK